MPGILDWLQTPAYQQPQGISPQMMQMAGVPQTSRLQAIGQALMGFGQGVNQSVAQGRGGGLGALAGGAMGAAGGVLGQQQGEREQTMQSLLQQAQIAKLMRGDAGDSSAFERVLGSAGLTPEQQQQARQAYVKKESSAAPTNPSDLEGILDTLSGGDPAKRAELAQQWFGAKTRPPAAPSVSVNVGAPVVNLPDTQPLTTPNVTDAQKGVMSIDDNLSLLDRSLGDYKRTFSTLPTQFQQSVSGWKEYFGGTLTPDQEAQRKDFIRSRAQIGQFSAERLTGLFGAALSVGEQGRADAFIPNFDKDTPIELQTKLETSRDILRAASLRKKLALAAGIDVSDAAELARSVGDVDTIQRDPATAVAKLAQDRFPGRSLDDPEVSAFVDKLLGQIGG